MMEGRKVLLCSPGWVKRADIEVKMADLKIVSFAIRAKMMLLSCQAGSELKLEGRSGYLDEISSS